MGLFSSIGDFVAPALGGTAGFLIGGPAGAMIGAGMGANFSSTMQTNAANEAIAGRQMDFQQMMSNTAHQREVQDLMAAGLNPNLSAGGNGSSTPTGASATMQAPQIDMPAIMNAKQLDLNQQKVDIERANSAADIAKTMSDTDLNKMKKVLAQKGMLRANLEGEASSVLTNILHWLKDSKAPAKQKLNNVIQDQPEFTMP